MKLNPESFHETCNLFSADSAKLEEMIYSALKNPEKLSISEIIGIYYQVIHVTSLIKVLRKHFDNLEEKNIPQKLKIWIAQINQIEKKITEQFDNNLHPSVMKQLTNEIAWSMNNLKSAKKGVHGQKSKHIIQTEAEQFEKLRQMMSSKEFVIQYDKGLKHNLKK